MQEVYYLLSLAGGPAVPENQDWACNKNGGIGTRNNSNKQSKDKITYGFTTKKQEREQYE